MKCKLLRTLFLFLALAPIANISLSAKQYALVVGINDYEYLKPHLEARRARDKISDLEGAENDAILIAQSLKSQDVDLPESRILLSRDATLANFLIGWKQMTNVASPGDTLIISFSGHGGQESEVSEPIDELDGRDETIMFTDFNPRKPRQGRLNDDQLRELMWSAREFKILWVMDSCHSGGLERSVRRDIKGLSRNAGNWAISIEPLADEIEAKSGDAGATLAHVTKILATASDRQLVDEVTIDGKQHGALSYFFAQAVAGAADRDGNNFVSRRELDEYLNTQVMAKMNQLQQPRILPRGDSTVALSIKNSSHDKVVESPDFEKIRVHVEGFSDLLQFDENVEIVEDRADVTFAQELSGYWSIYNHTGDKISSLRHSRADVAQNIIARARLIKAFPRMRNTKLPNADIIPSHSPKLQKIGTRVKFRFPPPSTELPYTTVFNLAGNGTFQYLYPMASELPLEKNGYVLEFNVVLPAGADQLVGVHCNQNPIELQRFLKKHDQGPTPGVRNFERLVRKLNCQISRIGLFTSE